MEPIPNEPPRVLVVPSAVHVVEDDGTGLLIPAEFRYDCSDPYAVSLAFGPPASATVWTFARELLADGVHEPVGDGDVHAWPGVTGTGYAVVLLELVADDLNVILALLRSEVVPFLTQTYKLVPAGRESGRDDLEVVLASILTSVVEGGSEL